MNTNDKDRYLLERLREALRSNETNTPVSQAVARLKQPFIVGDGKKWLYEGFVSMASAVRQALAEIDDSISPDLPPFLLEPGTYAKMFRIPLEDFNWQASQPNTIAITDDLVRMENKLDNITDLLVQQKSGVGKTAIDGVLIPELEDENREQPPYQFQRCGKYWIVRFTTENGSKEKHFQDLEGERHIAKLLAHPDKPIEAFELQGRQDSPVVNQAMKPHFASDASDRQAIEKSLADLEQEMAQADDQLQKMELKEEYEQLSKLYEESKGRRLGPSSAREQARKAVRNAIDRAIKRISKEMPEFGKFLVRSILAHGTAFAYSPAPPAPKWVL